MKITQQQLSSGNIRLREGTYTLPPDFSYDLLDKNLTITGVSGKTIITSYDGKPVNDFNPIKLDTTLPDNNPNGIYVVWKHPVYSYGGGQAHINLKGVYNTDNLDCWYTQGTILQKSNGIWKRYYTGYGFKTRGNVTIRNVIFDNCQFYLFSPFGQKATDSFTLENCVFRNVSRVISSMLYGGIVMDETWFTNLQCYPSDGTFRFNNFTIRYCIFEKIHTSIVWGFPPSYNTEITGNIIKNSETMIAGFNFFMKNYNDNLYFANNGLQIIRLNVFENIVTTNGWTTALIRTSGTSTISGNRFINNTLQVAFFYGKNSSFIDNIVVNNTNSGMQSVILLNKAIEGGLYIGRNTIQAKNSILLASEGKQLLCTINNNDIISKVVYSRNDSTDFTGEVLILNNRITSQIIVNIGSFVPITFNKLEISDNTLSGVEYLRTGSNVQIKNFIYNDSSN